MNLTVLYFLAFVASKAAVAPPPSLMDLDIPPPEGFLQKEREREAAAAAAAASRLSLVGPLLC